MPTHAPSPITINRRRLLRHGAGLTGLAAVAGLLTPASVIGAWQGELFDRRSARSGLDALLGGNTAQPHPDFVIVTPDEAENGAQVQIQVLCPLADIESIALLLSENPFPIAAIFQFDPRWDGMITTRVKMAASGRITAIARAGNQTWRADKQVKVVAGGCA